MKRIVSIRLEGGLGNQLFQFAMGFSIAKINNARIHLDKELLNENQKNNLEEFFYLEDLIVHKLSKIDSIKLSFHKFFLKSLAKLSRLISDNFAQRVCLKFGGFFCFSPIYKDYEKKNKNKILYIYGNWMSKKYFYEHENEIKKLISKDLIKDEYAKKVSLAMRNSNSIAIHIRLGDYLDSKWNAALNVCKPNYFLDGIKLIKKYDAHSHTLFIFSNSKKDLEHIKNNYNLPKTNIHYVFSGDDVCDLNLMAKCKKLIICNSTYSWWADFFSNSTITVAPRKWNDGRWNMSDIYNDHWEIVDN